MSAGNVELPQLGGVGKTGSGGGSTEKNTTAVTNAAGLVTKDGKPVHFTITTRKDGLTNENTPSVYYYIEGTMTAARDTGEFMPIEECLEG